MLSNPPKFTIMKENRPKQRRQLVKVDEKGIYLEVEKVNEPREYRIVRDAQDPI